MIDTMQQAESAGSPHRTRRWLLAPLAGACAVAALVGLAPAAAAASPGADGRIAYVASADGDLEIYVMAADGSDPTNLTNHPARDQDPSWSPDGSRIAWSSTVAGAHLDIWVMNADGSARTNLTPGPNQTGTAGTGIQPSWSPDGSRIAFACNGDIWTIGADGSSPVNLTDDPALPAAGGEPAWSPDGTKIAYTRGADVWVMNADGTAKAQLTATTGGLGTEKAPDWSPDGVHLAYERSGQIWRMRADGTAQQPLTGGPGESGARPAWSPSGTKIVFSSNAFSAPNGYDVFTMNPDGTAVTRTSTTVPGSETDPTWQASAPTGPVPSYLTLGVAATGDRDRGGRAVHGPAGYDDQGHAVGQDRRTVREGPDPQRGDRRLRRVRGDVCRSGGDHVQAGGKGRRKHRAAPGLTLREVRLPLNCSRPGRCRGVPARPTVCSVR